MRTWLNKLIRSGVARRSSPAHAQPAYGVDCKFSVDALSKDFETRTWQFDYYRPILAGKDDRLLHWIGSTDRSGYVRERCLRWLIANYTVGDENRILLRLEDWVPQIQSLAQEWALTFFREVPFERIRANANLLLHLLRKDKLRDDPAVAVICAAILQKTGASTREEFFSLPKRFRRYLYLRSLASDQALRSRILEDADPSNRMSLLTASPRLTLTPNERATLKVDASALIRRRLLQWRLDSGDSPSREELLAAACDSNLGIRDIARYWLMTLHGVDAYALYQSLPGEERFYIADYAKASDIKLFLEGARHPNRRVSLLCLRAICLADCQALKQLDIRRLIGTNRRTRLLLCRYLPKALDIDELRVLRPLFCEDHSRHFLTFLNMVLQKSYWNFIDVALGEVLINPSPALVAFVQETIIRSTAIYESPTAELRQRICVSIAAVKRAGMTALADAITLLEFSLRPS